jgi:hypothetical protein
MSTASDRGGTQGAGDDLSFPNMENTSIEDVGDEPVSATAGVVLHQGSELPKVMKCDLPSIDKLSSDETDSTDWVSLVKNSLRPLMLEAVIDSSLPRPSKSDPLYRRWNFWSSSVSAWMQN